MRISLVLIFSGIFLLQVPDILTKDRYVGDCIEEINFSKFHTIITFICFPEEREITYFDDSVWSINCSLQHSDHKIFKFSVDEIRFSNCLMPNIKYKIFNEDYHGIQILNVSNVELEFIPTDFFNSSWSLHTLIAAHNNLTSLQPLQFSYAPKLKNLDLSFNRIRDIEQESFSDTSSIENLNLSRNHIFDIHKNAFDHLHRLIKLDLSNNFINMLENETFATLQTLEYLYLAHNRLSHIEDGTFLNQTELHTLDLSHNFLKTIHLTYGKHRLPHVNLLRVERNSDLDLNGFTRSFLPSLRYLRVEGSFANCSYLKKHLDPDTGDLLSMMYVNSSVCDSNDNQTPERCVVTQASEFRSDNNVNLSKLNGIELMLIVLCIANLLILVAIVLFVGRKYLPRLKVDNISSNEFEAIHFVNANHI